MEAGNVVKLVWQLFVKFVYLFYLYLSVALICALLFIDESTFNSLLSTPIGDVLHFRNGVVTVMSALTVFTFIVFIVMRTIDNRRSAKEQYEAENKEFVNDTTRQIALIEEVLHRHHLINKKEL